MILLGAEQMKLGVTQSRLEQSCNLGWEDKSDWCLRSLELAAFNSAPILLLQLFQASVVAFTTDMNWKTPVFWNCCSSCTSFFSALVFPVVREDHSSLHIFFFSVAGKDAQRGERKAKLFLLQRELVEESLRVHSCRTGDILRVSEGGEFQEWSGLRKDGLEVSLPQFNVRWCKQDPESLGAEGSSVPLLGWAEDTVTHTFLGHL